MPDTPPLLDQLPLFSYDELNGEADDGEARKRKRNYPRGYDAPMLRYIGYHRFVTTHQLVYRFFVYAGKGSRYGFQLVRELEGKGLLNRQPLDPEKGATSRDLLSLTEKGWMFCGHKPPSRRRLERFEDRREYYLQFAELLLERESTGWHWVSRRAIDPESGLNRVFVLLRDWALAEYEGRPLNSYQRQERDSLRRAPEFTIDLDVLWHPADEAVRMILPVRRGLSFKRKLEELPARRLKGFPALPFELVCADLDLLDSAHDTLRRWGRRHKLGVDSHVVSHFRARPHPRRYEPQGENRYAKHGVGDPRHLV